ncbi:MAG: nitroreductase [Gemmatimonadales bacterium]|nr:nitroreductase [Gemmatimonadales bacterium]
MDAYDAIHRRASVRSFRQAPVPRDALERMLSAAVRAPNHKLTEPWRFAVITGASLRRYAEIRRAHRAKRFEDPTAPESVQAIEKTYREHLETPAFIVVMCAVSDDEVRREEDYAATMMALENLLIAATAEGLGTYLRTGGIMELPEVRALVGAPEDHRIVAIVSVGYPAATDEPKKRTDVASKTLWLD